MHTLSESLRFGGLDIDADERFPDGARGTYTVATIVRHGHHETLTERDHYNGNLLAAAPAMKALLAQLLRVLDVCEIGLSIETRIVAHQASALLADIEKESIGETITHNMSN